MLPLWRPFCSSFDADSKASLPPAGVRVQTVVTMSSVVRLRLTDAGDLGVHVDLMALEAPMKAALENVAIYLGYAVGSTKGEPLSSIVLDHAIKQVIDGVPDPVPEKDREEYQARFRRWAIGQALTEIDQSYQRFVVAALETKADLINFRDRRQLAKHKANLANSWTVHEQLFAGAPAPKPDRLRDSEYLRTLQNARNCLAHDSGIVTKRRLIEDGTMRVRWPGLDMYQLKNGRRKLLPRDQRVPDWARGAKLIFKRVVRERIYKLGDMMRFSASDLSEILFLYQVMAMNVGGEMHRFVAAIGAELDD
jgi:hypothetical protein